jgi:hypothetical protein
MSRSRKPSSSPTKSRSERHTSSSCWFNRRDGDGDLVAEVLNQFDEPITQALRDGVPPRVVLMALVVQTVEVFAVSTYAHADDPPIFEAHMHTLLTAFANMGLRRVLQLQGVEQLTNEVVH